MLRHFYSMQNSLLLLQKKTRWKIMSVTSVPNFEEMISGDQVLPSNGSFQLPVNQWSFWAIV